MKQVTIECPTDLLEGSNKLKRRKSVPVLNDSFKSKELKAEIHFGLAPEPLPSSDEEETVAPT